MVGRGREGRGGEGLVYGGVGGDCGWWVEGCEMYVRGCALGATWGGGVAEGCRGTPWCVGGCVCWGVEGMDHVYWALG